MNPSQSDVLNNKEFDPSKYAAIYARQSSKTDGFSIQSQIEDCKNYLIDKNLLMYKTYEDKESGTKDFQIRRSFVELLNDMYAGMFKTILVIRMDRLTRNIEDFIRLKNIFKKHGVKVIYVKEPQLNFEDTSYMSNFIHNMIMAVSTFEPDNINDRTSFGREQARKAGNYKISAKIPYGFVLNKNERRLRVDTARRHIIERIYEEYLKFKESNNKQVLKDLVNWVIHEEAKLNNDHRKIDNKFITDLIIRPVYARLMFLKTSKHLEEQISFNNALGIYQFNEDNLLKCVNVEDGIVSEDLWKKVVILHLDKKLDAPNEEKAYLFKKLLFCGECKKEVKLIEEIYQCPDKCTYLNLNSTIKLIISKLLEDTSTDTILENIKSKITFTKRLIRRKKATLLSLNNKSKTNLYDLIINGSLSPENKEKYIVEENNRQKLIETLQTLGQAQRELESKAEGINLFKFQMEDFNYERDLAYILNNKDYMHELITRIAVKVVLRSNGGSPNIRYFREQKRN